MPFLQRSDSIAANAFNPNVWAGTQYEFAPYRAALALSVLGSAAGLKITFATGSDTLTIDQDVSVVAAVGRFGTFPDDYVISDAVGPGERIVEGIRNSTAGALSHFSSIRLEPF
jgi:hypothetical protein